MTAKVKDIDKTQSEPKSTTDGSVVPVEKRAPSVADVIAVIRKDSSQRPDKYLDEVQVPGGGE